MKKIKIGIIGDQFGNIFRGGAEVQLEKTMLYLQKTNEVDTELISYETRNITNFDIIHFFKSMPEFSPLASFLKKNNVPYVVSTVTIPKNYKKELLLYSIAKFFPNKWKNYWISPAMRLSLWNNATRLFPNTDKEKKFVSEVTGYDKNKIIIIPNGLDLLEMPEENTSLCYEKFPELKNEKFILNVARIERRKNQKNLVLAAKELNIPVVIVGSILEEDYYKEIKKINYDKLYYLGPIFDKSVLYSIFSACSLFCLPSIVETPGIAAMEAAYYNKPIVITKNGGTRYYFKNTAYYVDWKNIKEIKNGIENMINKKVETKELISQYSWDRIASLYVSIYKEILQK